MLSRVIALLCVLPLSAVFSQTPQSKLIEAGRAQVGVTVVYDPEYVVLAYPGGDVPQDRGVCTDVVIRSLRSAFSMDLQKLVHEDMKSHFSVYPKEWGLSNTDKNIDHRRVPNLQTWFKRHAKGLKVTDDPASYLPGDIVTSLLPPHLPHIMIVSDKKTDAGVPLVIHNIGRGAREEDMLFAYPLTAHYRLDWEKLTPPAEAR
jgi:uncharacterized protein YijF (DUF1287 family)